MCSGDFILGKVVLGTPLHVVPKNSFTCYEITETHSFVWLSALFPSFSMLNNSFL